MVSFISHKKTAPGNQTISNLKTKNQVSAYDVTTKAVKFNDDPHEGISNSIF